MAAFGGDAAAARPLLRVQYDAMNVGHAASDHSVIERSGVAVGQVRVRRDGDILRILDLSILAAERGRGVGAAVLGSLQARAARDGIAVRFAVERSNPALRLYERLGWRVRGENATHLEMEWISPRPPADPG